MHTLASYKAMRLVLVFLVNNLFRYAYLSVSKLEDFPMELVCICVVCDLLALSGVTSGHVVIMPQPSFYTLQHLNWTPDLNLELL